MPRHRIDTLRGTVKCRANSTTTAVIAVRQVKPFEVGRERSVLREEDNILCNPVSGTNYCYKDVMSLSCFASLIAREGVLQGFHLPDSDYCSCGEIGTALHYATECIYTVSWHMRKPAPNFEQEWLKRVANNLVSRQRIRGIIKFISENRDLFRPP
ncbi:hypothetical protein AVEN_74405-1 [Araneus ventricosus]|uniref:Uncharacterized protein n=1 Tax=Araneus ventricosus TaxID=182803 RepID=A0A4Y2J974_ARAVE|nr:hypothetical protein AVEN_74405-1 [Araneus ventricosus]